MAAIAAETDPTKRLALMREHYEAMYRDMQMLRGMGWMWTPDAAATLPDGQSRGAGLVSNFCSQCHAPPSPALHTASEWNAVIARMRGHMQDAAAGGGMRLPSDADLQTLGAYLSDHARTQ
jgi:cytochrome c5